MLWLIQRVILIRRIYILLSMSGWIRMPKRRSDSYCMLNRFLFLPRGWCLYIMRCRIQLFLSELGSSSLQHWLLLSGRVYLLFYLSFGLLLHCKLNLAYCMSRWNLLSLRIFIVPDMSSRKLLSLSQGISSFNLSKWVLQLSDKSSCLHHVSCWLFLCKPCC